MSYVKIYGERNCGTNYFEQLVRCNMPKVQLVDGVAPKTLRMLKSEGCLDFYFHCRSILHGWKHEFISNQLVNSLAKGSCLPIFIVKNPTSFLLSLYKRPYNLDINTSKLSFEEFLVESINVRRRERLPIGTITPIDLWNTKVKSYIDANNRGIGIIIKYEDILTDPLKELNKIFYRLNLEEALTFTNYERSTKEKTYDFNYYKRYYLEEDWRDKISEEAKEIIYSLIDWHLCDQLSYKP